MVRCAIFYLNKGEDLAEMVKGMPEPLMKEIMVK